MATALRDLKKAFAFYRGRFIGAAFLSSGVVRQAKKDVPMGNSFFVMQNYSDLRNASQTFSDLISAAPTTYGLTSSQATSYKTLNDAYVAKFLLADAPETRTKVTIIDRNDAAVPLKAKASALAKAIDAAGIATDGQKAALGISVRAIPEPSPAPGTCGEFKVELQLDGSIIMSWKANNPVGMSGVTYQVYSRVGSVGEFKFRGATGEKKFFDTIPVGTAQMQYRVRGIRPTGAGAWGEWNVNFGEDSGTQTATVVENKSPKLAA